MARTTAPSRASRHAIEHDDDLVVARMVQAGAWARENARILVIGVIILAVAIVGAIYYAGYRSNLRNAANTRLLEIRQTAATGNFPLAAKDLQTFIDRFGGTPSEPEARLLLGQIYLTQNQPKKATEAVKPAMDAGGVLGTSAGLLLGAAYEMAQQPDQAVAAYLAASKSAPMDFQRNEAIENAARVRVQQGDTTGAIQLYDQLIASAPEGPQRDIYQMRREELTTAQKHPAS